MKFRNIFPGYRWVRFTWAMSQLFPLFILSVEGLVYVFRESRGLDDTFPPLFLSWFLFCWIVFGIAAWVVRGFKPASTGPNSRLTLKALDVERRDK